MTEQIMSLEEALSVIEFGEKKYKAFNRIHEALELARTADARVLEQTKQLKNLVEQTDIAKINAASAEKRLKEIEVMLAEKDSERAKFLSDYEAYIQKLQKDLNATELEFREESERKEREHIVYMQELERLALGKFTQLEQDYKNQAAQFERQINDYQKKLDTVRSNYEAFLKTIPLK